MYSSLSCSWSFSWLSLSSISCLIALSISRTTELLPRGSEPSKCFGWTCLTSGEKVSTRLKLHCLRGSSGASLSCCGCCISAGSSSSLTASICLPMFMFLGPLVISVNVRGDVLGSSLILPSLLGHPTRCRVLKSVLSKESTLCIILCNNSELSFLLSFPH